MGWKSTMHMTSPDHYKTTEDPRVRQSVVNEVLAMTEGRVLLFTLLFGLFGGYFVRGQITSVEPVTEICLGCICEAVSNCDRTLQCEGDVCGIFRITWAYWADAGKPTLQNDDPNANGAYSRCSNDPVCAGKTVNNYMNRFAQDCNGDGKINCYDYAAIHRHGGYGCRNPLDAAYQTKFDQCQRQVAQFIKPQ